MEKIVTVTGTELSDLLRILRSELSERHDSIHTFRVAIQGDGFKFKVNEGAWSVGYGGQKELSLF